MILITGNSGYIGTHLTKILESDYGLYGIDKNIPTINIQNFQQSNILNNVVISDKVFDCVIHLAAEVSVNKSVENPILYYQTNVMGTLNILKNIKTKSFIFASTGSAEYSNNPYSISKRMAEDVIMQYCKENDIEYTIFRFYNVIGKTYCDPTNPDGLLWNLIKAKNTGIFYLYGNNYNTIDGSAVRDYIHVEEVCLSIKKAIYDHSDNIENLGNGTGYSVKQMIDIFKKVNNCDFRVIEKERRLGDLEVSVLKQKSKYMTNIYSIEDYLKI